MPHPETQRHHPVYLFFTGLCMGSADVVPGVSGGTIAFIMGVYVDLLAAIKSFDVQWAWDLLRGRLQAAWARVPWSFLVPLLLGIVTAVLSLAELLAYLMQQHESLLFAFFFGLVVASILAMTARHTWTLVGGIGCLVGAGFAFWIVGLVPVQAGHSPAIMFGSGALAICAMILPGISGSFVMLILGQYQYCVEAISGFVGAMRLADLSAAADICLRTLLPIGLGLVVGLALFARVLSWLLSRCREVTIASLIGFMVGSLRRLWPFKEYLSFGIDRHGEPVPLSWRNVWPVEDPQLIFVGLALFAAGFIVLSLIDHIYDRRNPIVLLVTQRRWQP